MANEIILERAKLLRTLVEDSEIPEEDKEDAYGLLREIEEEARK